MKDNKYKYIHILWANELKFNEPLVDLVNNPDNLLHPESTLIVTPHKHVFDGLNKYSNVVYDGSNRNLFNKYYSKNSWIISHDFPNKKIGFTIFPWVKKRIVYRYWGGRRVFNESRSTTIARKTYDFLVKQLYSAAFRHIYDGMAAIGIANVVDEYDLADLIKKTPFFRLSYKRNMDPSEFDKIRESAKLDDDKKLHVMVGHKSDLSLRHIHYLEVLKKYDESLITIYLPLSYGDKEYAETIKKYIHDNNIQNVKIQSELMSYEQYLYYLNNIDIALIDCYNSFALGNIQLLLNLRKTLYLSRGGIIQKAFEKEKVPYRVLDEIENMDFEEFKDVLEISDSDIGEKLRFRTYAEGIDTWRDLYKYLDNKDNNGMR